MAERESGRKDNEDPLFFLNPRFDSGQPAFKGYSGLDKVLPL